VLPKKRPLPVVPVLCGATGAGWRRRLRNADFGAPLCKSVVQPGRLLGVFASLAGSHIGGAVLGLIFWTIAARALTPKQLGVGAALVAAMTLLSTFGILGVGTLLLERVKVVSVTDRRSLFSTGLSIAGIGGAVIAAGWLGVSALVHVPGALGDLSLSTALLLVAATGIDGACTAFDQAAIGMGASSVQLRRNLVASGLKIAVLSGAIGLDIRSGQAILVSWTGGLVGSLLTTRLRRHLPSGARATTKQRWHLVRNYWTAAIGHHGLTLAMAAGGLMLPVVVASIMPAAQTAYFAQARLLADAALALPYFLTIALFATAEGVEGFRRKAPRTIIAGMVLAVSLVVAAALFGRVPLLMFGTTYSQASLPLLLLLLANGPVLVIKDHFVVLRRLQGMRKRGALTMGLWTTAELAGAVAGGLVGGMTMLCLGWLATSATCALIALPVLLRGIRRQPPGDKSRLSVMSADLIYAGHEFQQELRER
jgi:O-antigen/teichoic acid export membrane protein